MSLLFLNSCSIQPFLAEDEILLHKNNISIESDTKVDRKNNLKSEAFYVLTTKPNENFLRVFKTGVWFYYKNKDKKDSKFKSAVDKYIAEKPAFHDTSDVNTNVKRLNKFLKEKGYRDASVKTQIDTTGYKANVSYMLNPGPLTLIRTLRYSCSDPKIQQILDENKEASFLKIGEPLDIALYNQEVKRITTLLNQQGYKDFYSAYIDDLEAKKKGNEVDINLIIKTPANNESHLSYINGSIFVYPDYLPSDTSTHFFKDTIDNVQFLKRSRTRQVRNQVIFDNIYLNKGEKYNVDDFTKTYRQLGELSPYKFVSIKPQYNRLDSNVVDYLIYLRKGEPKSFEGQLDLFYSVDDRNSFFGTGIRTSFVNKNFFGAAELATTSFDISGEFDLVSGPKQFLQPAVFNASVSFNLQFPRFEKYPLFSYSLLNKARILNDNMTKLILDESRSVFDLRVEYSSYINLYNYYSADFRFGYLFKSGTKKRYGVNHLGITYWAPEVLGLDTLLGDSPHTRLNFENTRLFTGFLFRDFSYNYESQTNRAGEKFRFSGNFETSGLEFALIRPYVSNPSLGNVQFDQFFRLNVEAVYKKEITQRTSFALKVASGIAIPFGYSASDTVAVPYVKQFVIGGANSLRAWEIRQLGPGGKTPDASAPREYFQTGDFLFEASAELRFPLFWRFEGAAFLDAGNIWLIRNDNAVDDIEFIGRRNPDFYKQIAIGTGLGVRWDLSIVLVRFDVGYKLRNPYPTQIDNMKDVYWRFQTGANFKSNRHFNLAIDYPF